MEAAEEADDVLAAGVVAGELHGALDGLGAGVAVVEAVRAGHGGDGGEALGQRGHVLVVEVGAGHVDEFGGLVLNGLDYFGMTVAGGVDGDAGGEVEELVAVDVGDADAAAGLGHHGIAAGVAGGDEALIVGNDLFCERAGEGGLQFGAELAVVRGAGVTVIRGSGCSCGLSFGVRRFSGALVCRSSEPRPNVGRRPRSLRRERFALSGTSPAGGVSS